MLHGIDAQEQIMSAHRHGSLPVGFDAYRECIRSVMTPGGLAEGLQFRPRESDLIISPFAKCGTTWLQQIVHGLRSRGDLDFDDISRVVPWIETAFDLGLDLSAPQPAQPRAFKSHLPWSLVPKGGRYIVSLRDPRDALVSLFRFMEGWFFAPGSVSIGEFARRKFLERDGESDYWSHLLSWWEQRDNTSILLLAYEHMKQDLPAAVGRIARFIGGATDAEAVAIATAQASLESMSRNRHLYDDLLIRELAHTRAGIPLSADAAKVRAGAVGAHARELPADIGDELDAVWKSVVAPVTGARDYAALIRSLRSGAQSR
jgi:hypothetical protein